MTERKSSRARKSVDYSKFGGEDDLDDDFADSTPPVSKRAKLSTDMENKDRKKSKTEDKKENKARKIHDRKSVEDRLFERELQEALELSISQSDASQGAADVPCQEVTGAPKLHNQKEDVPPSPILSSVDDPPVLARQMGTEEEIEVLEIGVEDLPSSRRRTSKAKRYIESDSEEDGADSDFVPDVERDSYQEESDSDDDEDYNCDDSDSDFGSSKKKKSKKGSSKEKNSGKKTTSKTTTSEPTSGVAKSPRSKPAKGSSLKSSSNIPKPLAASSPSTRTPNTGLTASKPPNWKPPGAANEEKRVLTSTVTKSHLSVSTGGAVRSPNVGVSIKSPSTGLRIGLSRNMKLKPLHPNLKIQP